MLSLTDITVYLGGQLILDAANCRVGDGERVAIVGPNGAGKSTLLKAVAGQVRPESGEVMLPKGTRIGYLPQQMSLDSRWTVREELRSVFTEALAALEEMETLEHRMGEIPHDSDEFKRVAARYDRLTGEVHRLDAYSLDSHVGQVTAGLGFTADDLDRGCHEFSGGWQMRIALAKLLLSRPDVLLLDEPTNHLDLETILWLEEWLLAQRSSVLFVSHERSFMDRLAHRVVEIDRARLTAYKGTYSDYLEQRVERCEVQRRAYENQQREIARLQRFIARFRYQANKAALVQSRVKQLERMERLEPPAAEAETIHFRFPPPPRSNKEVITLEGVGHRYGDGAEAPVFEDVDWTVYRGEKIALVGVNGAGKTTVMKIMAGLLEPWRGSRAIGTQVMSQYFSQYGDDDLNPEQTVEQSLAAVAPTGEAQQARNVAGAFLFTGDDVDKPTHVLSGGERTRLRLARMLFSPANLLLLDEPTNHLDIGSRRTLEEALRRYEGTVILVAHDRVFVDRVATKIVDVCDGRVRDFPGTYRDYLRRHREEMGLSGRDSLDKGGGGDGMDGVGGAVTAMSESPEIMATLQVVAAAREAQKPRETKAPHAKDKAGANQPQDRKAARRRAAEVRRAQAKRVGPLRARVRGLEKEIHDVEARQAAIQALLAEPETYANPDRVAELGKEKKALAAYLSQAMGDWEGASAELEAALAE